MSPFPLTGEGRVGTSLRERDRPLNAPCSTRVTRAAWVNLRRPLHMWEIALEWARRDRWESLRAGVVDYPG